MACSIFPCIPSSPSDGLQPIRYEICEKGIRPTCLCWWLLLTWFCYYYSRQFPCFMQLLFSAIFYLGVSPLLALFFFHSHSSGAQVCSSLCRRMCVGSVCMCKKTKLGWLPVCFGCLNDDCGLLQNQSVCSLWMNTGNSQNEHTGCGTAAHSHHSRVARKCRWWLGQRTVGRLSATLPQIRVGFAPMYSHCRRTEVWWATAKNNCCFKYWWWKRS